MTKRKVPFRRPSADEQTVLRQMQVQLLVRPEDIQQCNQILVEEHYLHSAQLVGEQLRYAVVWQGRWLAVATWSAAALHLKARDGFIGWSQAQRRERLALVVNNSRLCVLPECHYPNLVSRFMKLMLGRLSVDWERVWQHPVALAESFVDPSLYPGTAYKVSGWTQLGYTRGWKRSAVDFYEPHGSPKQVWVRELVQDACAKLRAKELPAAWAGALRPARRRCTAKVREIESLMTRLGRDVPEFRRQQALAYPLAGMLVLIAMAMFSGVSRGYEDLADYAATLSQAQLRALRFRQDPRTRRVRCPQRTTFERVLKGLDEARLQQVLLLWQEQVLGPVEDRLVIIDGKTLRHAGVTTVSAVNGTGRWLGSTLVSAQSNEIPAGRQQLARLDLADKIVVADAAHTQVAHAKQILYQQGGEYLLTVKKNQKELFTTLETLFAPQPFSPSAHAAHPGADAGAQPQPPRNPSAGLSGGFAPAGELSGSADHRAAAAAGAAPG
ncbi:MAG TPA: ISAs1 family transposase [Candidatus Paceibacterota bacterium]|nr:ISAs1 family transposase [Verrucomicrobiota bacterium]HSA12222.1 ISAs1 family transposase [Candidatus Paceibacterota bacterium]